MAMRMSSKDGRAPRNLLEGTGNLKQRYYKDKSFQENLRASQARVEQANLEAESATRLADRVDTAKNFGRSVFDFIKAAPKYIVGSTGAVLADSPFSPLRGQIRSIKIGDTEFLTPSARFQAGQDLIGQGQYKQGIREIGTGALDIASTVATPLKSLQALRVGKFGKAFLTGAVPTGLFGAGYQGLESFGADKTPAEIAKESAYAGAVSFGAGGFFGLGLAGLGKGGEMIAKRLGRGEKITPAEIAKITSESVPEKAQEVKPPVKTVDKKAETTAPKEETVSFYHRGENKATLHGGDWVDGDLKTHEGRAPADNITHIEIPKSQVSKYIREVSPEHSKEKVFRIKDGEMIPPEYIKRNDFLKKQGVSFDKPNTKASQASDDPLIQEARKYKSAEEFVNSFNLMKSGEVTSIGQLPISKVNKTQIRAITERGLPHTDTGLKVKDFTPGRKVTQPLEVYSKGGSYVVENGNHRLAQALANGDTHIPVVFKRGEGKTYSTHTKSQLTDLWKKANDDDAAKTTPKTEKIPEQPKPSGFAEKIKKDAIEKELAKEFPDSATYTPKILKEEAAKTKEIFDSGIDRVVKILEGKEELPNNIRHESFSVAAKIFAKNTGEEATRVRNALIAGKYSKIASEAGQGLSLLRDGESNTDPVRIINRIRKAREEAATKRTKSKGTNEAKKSVKTDVKKVLDRAKKVPTKETWTDFVKNIEC